MADKKKMTPEELNKASGGGDRQLIIQRLRAVLSESDVQRVQNAELSAAELIRILAAGSVAVASALQASGITVKPLSPTAPPIEPYLPRRDRETAQ